MSKVYVIKSQDDNIDVALGGGVATPQVMVGQSNQPTMAQLGQLGGFRGRLGQLGKVGAALGGGLAAMDALAGASQSNSLSGVMNAPLTGYTTARTLDPSGFLARDAVNEQQERAGQQNALTPEQMNEQKRQELLQAAQNKYWVEQQMKDYIAQQSAQPPATPAPTPATATATPPVAVESSTVNYGQLGDDLSNVWGSTVNNQNNQNYGQLGDNLPKEWGVNKSTDVAENNENPLNIERAKHILNSPTKPPQMSTINPISPANQYLNTRLTHPQIGVNREKLLQPNWTNANFDLNAYNWDTEGVPQWQIDEQQQQRAAEEADPWGEKYGVNWDDTAKSFALEIMNVYSDVLKGRTPDEVGHFAAQVFLKMTR